MPELPRRPRRRLSFRRRRNVYAVQQMASCGAWETIPGSVYLSRRAAVEHRDALRDAEPDMRELVRAARLYVLRDRGDTSLDGYGDPETQDAAFFEVLSAA